MPGVGLKIRRKLVWGLPSLMIATAPLAALTAQNEATLRQTFEGQTVTLKLDMPGTAEGVNVYPKCSTPLEFPKVANALKECGTAIRAGDTQMITKVRVKKNLIEVHLGGSRFNIRFDDVVPAEYLTPEGVMLALEKYVTLQGMAAAPAPAAADEPLDGVSSLRKGLTLAEVERLLGPATEATSADVGGLNVLIRSYMTEGQFIKARFANGVLIEFIIRSD